MKSIKTNFLLFALAPVVGFTFVSVISFLFESPQNSSKTLITEQVIRPVEDVAALGQLSTLGEVRKLAGPSTSFGGTPRIAELLVGEGDEVKKGQIVAIFDNRPQILADLEGVRAKIKTLDINIRIHKIEVSRYKQAAMQGAASFVLLEEKENELVRTQGQKEEAIAELKGLETDLSNSELKTPIDGIILRINAREGERPGEQGVLEVGNNQSMEAIIEVYESDVNRVELDQPVFLTSENGGFNGILKGRVKKISPQVRQRRVLSTDPTGDADSRIVEVRVTLEANSATLVNKLTGMKVIARFKSL